MRRWDDTQGANTYIIIYMFPSSGYDTGYMYWTEQVYIISPLKGKGRFYAFIAVSHVVLQELTSLISVR